MKKTTNNKYYWIKLKKNFFKKHEITIVENMKNGKEYVLFYLKLLVESASHDGELRFSDTIPYNDEMLSAITNTNIDTVRSAMKVFQNLKMIEILDNDTIYMLELEKMVGSETEWAEKKRKQRSKPIEIGVSDDFSIKKIECVTDDEKGQVEDIKGTLSDKSIRDKSIDIKENKKEKKFSPKTIINAFTTNKELRQSLDDYIQMRKTIKKPVTTDRTLNDRLKELNSLSDDVEIQIQIVNQSVDSCWQRFFMPKNQPQVQKKQPVPKIEDILPEGYDYLPEDVKRETYEHYQQVIQKGIEDGIYE